MKTLVILFAILLITGCAVSRPASQTDTMNVCKTLCRHGVSKYTDDTVECVCFTKEAHDEKGSTK